MAFNITRDHVIEGTQTTSHYEHTVTLTTAHPIDHEQIHELILGLITDLGEDTTVRYITRANVVHKFDNEDW